MKAFFALLVLAAGFNGSSAFAQSFSCNSGKPACVKYGQGIYDSGDIRSMESDFGEMQDDYNTLIRKYNQLRTNNENLYNQALAVERERDDLVEEYNTLLGKAKNIEDERNNLKEEFNRLLGEARQIESDYNACISR